MVKNFDELQDAALNKQAEAEERTGTTPRNLFLGRHEIKIAESRFEPIIITPTKPYPTLHGMDIVGVTPESYLDVGWKPEDC